MKIHTVKQGEDMVTIAANYFVADWKAIYDHAANKRLKEMRPDPMYLYPGYLYPGDVVYIPDLEPQTFNLAADQSHTLTVEVPKNELSLTLADEEGKPFANADYELVFGNTTVRDKLDGNGLLKRQIPAQVTRAKLTVWHNPQDSNDFLEYDLNFGEMDPADEITGINDFGVLSSDALSQFQADRGIEVTGELDQATLDELKKPDGAKRCNVKTAVLPRLSITATD